MGATRGLEKVIALATLGADWRAKVLADPAAAAREADIELTDTEQALLRTIARPTLEHMIDSFGKSIPRPSGIGKLAAGAAAAALLVSTATGCEFGFASGGIRRDVPPPKTEQAKSTSPTSGAAIDNPQPPAEK